MTKEFIASLMTKPIAMGLLRDVGKAAGAGLATYGVISGGDVEMFAGAFVTIATMILSALAKRA